MLEPTPYVEEREDPLGQFLFKKIREVVIKK